VDVFDMTEQEISWITTIQIEDGLSVGNMPFSVVKGDGLSHSRRGAFPCSCMPGSLQMPGIWVQGVTY